MKNNKITKPYLSKKRRMFCAESGKIAYKTLDPSNGGMGTKLKTANKIFA